MGERLFGAWDATNARALKELADSIEAVPTRTVKYRKEKGSVYLYRYHESPSDCYLTRLPSNLIRMLISYNTVLELLSFTMTCKQLGKFLFDKYISFKGDTASVGFYKTQNFSFQDHYDLVRIAELQGPHRMRLISTVRPEFVNIIQVSVRTDSFLSYFNSEIVECAFVRYSDDIEIRGTRPCIAGAELFDSCEDTVVCASTQEVALSFGDRQLRTQTLDQKELPLAVKFLAKGKLVLVQRQHDFLVYLTTLIPGQCYRHEGYVLKLDVPDPNKAAFATLSAAYITTYSVTFAGEIHKQFQWRSDACESLPIDFAIHREKTASGHRDFLFVLLKNGQLLANDRRIEKVDAVWRYFALCNGRLIAAGARSLFVFQYSETHDEYRSIGRFSEPFEADFFHLSVSRMKAATVYTCAESCDLRYYYPNGQTISEFASVRLPRLEKVSVQRFKEVTVVKGILMVQTDEEVHPAAVAFVVNFNLNSMLGSYPNVEQAAASLVHQQIAERNARKAKKLELKRKEREEKAKKKEEKVNKHRPKH